MINSDIKASVRFHEEHGRVVTITAVHPSGRFGELTLSRDQVLSFTEKPAAEAGFVNGGFFVMNRRIGDYLSGDECVLEQEPLSRLAGAGEVKAFPHDGFWQCMDTFREMQLLNELWASGRAPWKTW